MGNNNEPKRREVLQMAGISLGAVIGGSGVAAAKGSRPEPGNGANRGRGPQSHPGYGISVVGGKFESDVDPDRLDSETYDKWMAAIEGINSMIDNGHMTIEERDESDVALASASRNSKGNATVLNIHSTPSEIAADKGHGNNRGDE